MEIPKRTVTYIALKDIALYGGEDYYVRVENRPKNGRNRKCVLAGDDVILEPDLVLDLIELRAAWRKLKAIPFDSNAGEYPKVRLAQGGGIYRDGEDEILFRAPCGAEATFPLAVFELLIVALGEMPVSI